MYVKDNVKLEQCVNSDTEEKSIFVPAVSAIAK